MFDRVKDYGSKLFSFVYILFWFALYFISILIDDLIGEAVIPVNDLLSNVSNKRVIQLHKFGQTKTGSITAEVKWFFLSSF